MEPNAGAPHVAHFLPLVIVLLLVLRRTVVPQRISVTRMWISPIILCALVVWAIGITQRVHPSPMWEIVLGTAVGVALGAPFGFLRGKHTDVRPTRRPGVMYLGASWMATAVYLGAYGVRYGICSVLPPEGSLTAVVGDGLLGFACGFLVASYVAIFRKYELAVAQRGPAEP